MWINALAELVKGGSNKSDKLICALSCVYFFLRTWAAAQQFKHV